MLLDERQKEFVDKIVYEKKNFYSVSREMSLPINKVYDWYDELYDEIKRMKTEQALNIMEKYDLSISSHLEQMGKLYQKLTTEMENRDFSGLPTDKLYDLLMDVRHNINHAIREIENDDDDDWDDEDLDLPEDEDDDFFS